VDDSDKLSQNYSKKIDFLNAGIKLKETNIESLKLKVDTLAKKNQDLELELHMKNGELDRKLKENDEIVENLDAVEGKFRAVVSKQQGRIEELED
jgi:hypothetical protein